jgi:hypothetical protein
VKNRQSVAPEFMVGITATPGNMSFANRSIGFMTSVDNGGGAPGVSGFDWNSTFTPGSFTTRTSSARISSCLWPG